MIIPFLILDTNIITISLSLLRVNCSSVYKAKYYLINNKISRKVGYFFYISYLIFYATIHIGAHPKHESLKRGEPA